MADGFKSGSKWFGDALREETGAADELINSAVHAIDSHDELVAEVERLRGEISAAANVLNEVERVIYERVNNGAYGLDDIADEVSQAMDRINGYVD